MGVAAFVREEDEEAVQRDQERMERNAAAAATDPPTVKASGAVYTMGKKPAVPEAFIPRKLSWFNRYGNTRKEQLGNWLRARRRVEREHYIALHRGQQSKYLWARVEERNEQGKGKKGKSGKKGKGRGKGKRWYKGQVYYANWEEVPHADLLVGDWQGSSIANYADVARQYAASSASSSTQMPIPPNQQSKAPGLLSGASQHATTTSASASAPDPQSRPPKQEPRTRNGIKGRFLVRGGQDMW